MKRLSHLGFVGLLATFLAGCPVFSDNAGEGGWSPGCRGPSCTGASSSSSGSVAGCTTSADCGVNETCGGDNQCHSGDCTVWGCSNGDACTVDPASHLATCQPSGQSGASSSGSSSGGDGGAGGGSSSSTTSSGSGSSSGGGSGDGGAGGGASVVWCGNPADCAAGQTCAPDGTCHAGDCQANGCIYGYACGGDGLCTRANPAGCAKDADCANAGAGYACVSGLCAQAADQCWDQAQCTGSTGKAGNKCVSGKCTDACAKDADCPSGALCDTALGICSKPAKACTLTNDCGSATEVCVAGACVPRSDMGACDAGYAWVDNGCIPDQKASFVCGTDGELGSGAGSPGQTCAAGSICLHHGCYISCASDASVCSSQSSFPTCKTVTTSSGDHAVCGSDENLGGDCDPAKACSGAKVCIDGYCQ